MKKTSTHLAAPGGTASQAPSDAQLQPAAAAPGTISIPQSLGLAEMSESQLAQTFTKLDATREHYENLSGICATLQGLILIEAKRKIPHGKYQHWIESNFPKSYSTSNRFVRIAEDFIEKASGKNTKEARALKSVTGATFDNVNTSAQLLLTDLAASLESIRSDSIDLSHPMVQAISAYADGRSYNQLWLDLGPVSLGGSRDGAGRRKGDQKTLAEQAKIDEANRAYLIKACLCIHATIIKDRCHRLLNDRQLDDVIDYVEGAHAELVRWRKLPKFKRDEEILSALKRPSK